MFDRAELTQHVVQRLTRGVSRDTITREICDQTGMDWKQATAFLEEVESGESQTIARGNLPLMIGIGAIIMIGGFLSIGASLSALVGPIIDGTLGELSGDVLAIHLLDNWIYLVGAVTGVAMMAGGGFGIGRAMSTAA